MPSANSPVETRPTPEELEATISELATDPTCRIVGSLGRSVLHGAYSGCPLMEYDLRHEEPLGTTLKPRDVDIIGEYPEAITPSIHPVDIGCFRRFFATVVPEGDSWWLTSDKHQFSEELHPDTMERLVGKGIFGIEIPTVPLQTHRALYGIKGRLRGKDRLPFQLLNELCLVQPTEECLPDELFAPFRQLQLMNEQSIYLRVRSLYRRTISEDFRRKLSPLAAIVKNTAETE